MNGKQIQNGVEMVMMDWHQSLITLEIGSNHIWFIQLLAVEYPKFNSSVLVTENCTGWNISQILQLNIWIYLKMNTSFVG